MKKMLAIIYGQGRMFARINGNPYLMRTSAVILLGVSFVLLIGALPSFAANGEMSFVVTQIKEKEVTISAWETHMYIIVSLTLVVGILGAFTAALHNNESRNAKRAALLAGIVIAALTVIMNTLYKDNHWTIHTAIKEAKGIIHGANRELDIIEKIDMDTVSLIEAEDRILNELNRIGEMEKELRILFSQGTLNLVREAYAGDVPPEWATAASLVKSPYKKTPRYIYFIGNGVSASPDEAREKSLIDARKKAKEYFGAILQTDRNSEEAVARASVRNKIVDSIIPEGKYIEIDDESGKVRSMILVKIPRDVAVQKIKLYESHGLITDTNKYIEALEIKK